MTIEELEEIDRQFFEHLARKRIEELERGIAKRRAEGGRTDNLERALARLKEEQQ